MQTATPIRYRNIAGQVLLRLEHLQVANNLAAMTKLHHLTAYGIFSFQPPAKVKVLSQIVLKQSEVTGEQSLVELVAFYRSEMHEKVILCFTRPM